MDHPNDLPPVKFKVHRSFTSKQLSSPPAKVGPQNLSGTSRVVRIYYTDSDATDSSSDDDEQEDYVNYRKIKKKYVSEIKIGTFGEILPENPNGVVEKQKLGRPSRKNVKKNVSPNCPKYRGVRRRLSGKWAAEIRDSIDGHKLWLGVYDTAEEASYVYENAAMQFKEAKALKENNSKFPAPEMTVEMVCPKENEAGLSTTVIGDEWKPAEEVASEDGTWESDEVESCYLSKSTPLVYEEMMSMVDNGRCLDDMDLNLCSWNVEDFFENYADIL